MSSEGSAVMDLPPRPWGGAEPVFTHEQWQGPTPTSVGRRPRNRGWSPTRGTYPHVRGEEAKPGSWTHLR